MTYQQFNSYLTERESVVLFISHDRLLPEDIPYLEKLGRFMARHFLYCMFYTGYNTQADGLFLEYFIIEGYDWDLREDMHVMDPMHTVIISRLADQPVDKSGSQRAEPFYKNTLVLDKEKISEKMNFVDGAKKHFPEYAEEISTYARTGNTGGDPEVINKLRYTLMMMGEYELNVAMPDVVLIYNDLKNPWEGRVDDIISLCEHFEIPYADQKSWKKWLRDWKETEEDS